MLRLLSDIPRRFPVETALGVVFYIIALCFLLSAREDEDILLLYLPLQALTFWLGRVNRIAYVASFFLFVPLLAIDLRPFLWSSGFFFMYVLAGLLLLVGNRKMDNRHFVAHAAHVRHGCLRQWP